jgi:hypothetical protein
MLACRAVRLFCQLCDESDLLEAWLRHYVRLGVTCFHLVVHGGRTRNARLHALVGTYPIVIEQEVDGAFSDALLRPRLQALMERHLGEWVVLVDADELVEVPAPDLPHMARQLERHGAQALRAPFLQRVRRDGTLASPERIDDPWSEFPLGVPGLLRQMGSTASEGKYPLLRVLPGLALMGGNHHAPYGRATLFARALGVTHHFKWRRGLEARITHRARDDGTWGHESAVYLGWLEAHAGRLPLEGAFEVTTKALRRRGLLRPVRWTDRLRLWRRARRLAREGLTPPR